MKYLSEFKKNESGAVTVDWVVLTAAIVGIALAVIALISGGIQDASTGVNDELQTASAFTFGASAATAAPTLADYTANNPDYGSIITAINNDAPAGYAYVGAIDDATDTPIYQDTTGATNNVSVNGEIIDTIVYQTSGATWTGY